MMFLARELHMPNSVPLRNMVVDVADGVVKEIYQFAGEVYSMLLVDDIIVSACNSLESLSDIKENSHPCDGESLYAYLLDGEGSLRLIV